MGEIVTGTMVSSSIAVGLNKGYGVTTAGRKGKLNRTIKFVREVIREVAGFSPYERRMMELMKLGKDKRALKLAKKRLGSHLRGKKKREEMSRVLQEMRSKAKRA